MIDRFNFSLYRRSIWSVELEKMVVCGRICQCRVRVCECEGWPLAHLMDSLRPYHSARATDDANDFSASS